MEEILDKKRILEIIAEDEWMMRVLHAAEKLNLPDWMIGAGFVRNKIWDYLHGFQNEEVPTRDIDLAYFDLQNITKEKEREYDLYLNNIVDVEWETKNQARMHSLHGGDRYLSSKDAISSWPETCTCIAVKIENGKLKLIAPHGVKDLIHLTVRVSPKFRGSKEEFKNRVNGKKWNATYVKLTYVT